MLKPRHEPLDNPKHEQFARAILKKPSITQAYREAKPESTYETARSAGNRLIASNVDIRQRVLGLLEDHNASLPQVSNRVAHWLNQDAHPVQSMDAAKTILKIAGVLDPEDQAKNISNVNICIGIMSPDGTVNNVTIEG